MGGFRQLFMLHCVGFITFPVLELLRSVLLEWGFRGVNGL